jgi:transcriptional regulator with XRE-family HTH domain
VAVDRLHFGDHNAILGNPVVGEPFGDAVRVHGDELAQGIRGLPVVDLAVQPGLVVMPGLFAHEPGNRSGPLGDLVVEFVKPLVELAQGEDESGTNRALMEIETDALARVIGARVRHERSARGWTLDQLAAAAGVSRRMVVNVEQGGVNPSIGTLLRLSDALGVGLPALVEPPSQPVERVTRAGTAAVLWRGEHGGSGALVAASATPEVFELWHWTMHPGERHASEAHPPGTRELLHVLEGAMRIEIDDRVHELGTGDALTFRGDAPHSYACAGESTARFSLTVLEQGAGTTASRGASDD